MKFRRIQMKGKIWVYPPIKPHVPLLMLRPAKSIPFLCCQNTSEAECLPIKFFFLFIYLCTQYLGCGLIRYLICVATHTLVIKCQFNNKKVLSLGILNDLLIFYHSTINSPFSLLYSSFKTILSRFMPIKDQLRRPTCLTAAAGTGFGQDY